jgi:hypothetical protein
MLTVIGELLTAVFAIRFEQFIDRFSFFSGKLRIFGEFL